MWFLFTRAGISFSFPLRMIAMLPHVSHATMVVWWVTYWVAAEEGPEANRTLRGRRGSHCTTPPLSDLV